MRPHALRYESRAYNSIGRDPAEHRRPAARGNAATGCWFHGAERAKHYRIRCRQVTVPAIATASIARSRKTRLMSCLRRKNSAGWLIRQYCRPHNRDEETPTDFGRRLLVFSREPVIGARDISISAKWIPATLRIQQLFRSPAVRGNDGCSAYRLRGSATTPSAVARSIW
jgi:hypothetical protein